MSAPLWLVRTTRNEIRGPFTLEQVKAEISAGQFAPEDEICSGSGYWFFLHETEELHTQLGVTLPKTGQKVSQIGDEEITETDTETETLVLGEEIVAKETGSGRSGKSTKRKTNHSGVSPSSVRGTEELERASLLKMVAFVGLVLIVFLVAGALRILWTS